MANISETVKNAFSVSEKAFFKLLQLSLGNDKDAHLKISDEEWKEVYDISVKQALTAIVLDGVTCLPVDEKPPLDLVMNWINMVQRIEVMNRRLNRLVVMVADKFHQEGMDTVLLKGQGMSVLYPNPLHRTPGDIDLWVNKERKALVKYVRERCPDVEVVYHHIDFPVLKDAEMELHFTPSWMNNWIMNSRLQKMFKEWLPLQSLHKVMLPEKVGKVAVPNMEMNRIYILLHIYRHLFDEGIGLRQLLDYYHVLRQPCTENEKADFEARLKVLGMKRFASAVMYVEKVVFGLADEYMLVEPSEKYGKKLLAEIMMSGNFGKYDTRSTRTSDEKRYRRFFRRVGRNMNFITDYTSETLCSPIFKIGHYIWRRYNNYL